MLWRQGRTKTMAAVREAIVHTNTSSCVDPKPTRSGAGRKMQWAVSALTCGGQSRPLVVSRVSG